MAQEEIDYTLPSTGANDGRQVNLILTYDSSSVNADGSYTVTDATGTYNIVDNGGQIIGTDQITGLASAGSFAQNDNEFFINNAPTNSPIVDQAGISYTIDSNSDSNDGYGNVNFFDINGTLAGTTAPTDQPSYQENGANQTSVSSIDEFAVTCFATATLIQTARGNVPVEDLSVGDLVVTSKGILRPIRWLGHRTIEPHRHLRPHEAYPICIATNAFGDARPTRDLFVSPGHAICVDVIGEVLIPAGALVNGSTIRQVEVDKITYWHVELESHDVILAENLPAESYLEMGNRGFFHEADAIDLSASLDASPTQRTHADFCRPFHEAGSLVDVVKAQLRKRAEANGWALTSDLDLHLEVDGQRIDPIVRGLAARFVVPATVKDVWLVAPTARPCDTTGSSDGRNLGVNISAFRIDDGFELRDVAIDDPLLCIGFHSVEDGCRRWTAGRARLPTALWAGYEADFHLRIELAGQPVPRWVPPMQQTNARSLPEGKMSVVA